MTTRTHAPRPTDLVALVSFDGEVYENQAITREGLGKPAAAPRALAATIQRWLGRGRHVWVDVRGRQIQGIATARPLAAADAWEIDTLVDAGAPDDGVVAALLEQACEAAIEAGVVRLLIRMHADAAALPDALRAGFTPAVHEQLWVAEQPVTSTPLDTARGETPTSGVVREVDEADQFALFQLYNRALPIDARQALAVTFEEWQAVQERRWLARGGLEFVVHEAGRLRGVAQVSPAGQLTLLLEPGFAREAEALFAASREHLASGGGRAIALQPLCAGTPAALLDAHGYQAVDEYVLLARRTTRLLTEAVRNTAGRTVPTRG